MEFNIEMLEPGLYTHLSNEDYHRSGGLSKSGLALLRECPAKFAWRYILGNREEETTAMKIGAAFHGLVLEPEVFSMSYAVSPKFDGRTKEGKAGKAAFAGDHVGKAIIDQDDYSLISAMAEAVHAHPAASYLLGLEGGSEESFFWREEFTGASVLCKCRPDWRIPGKRILVDLKKTAKGAGSDAFSRTMFNLTYHIQAGLYLQGVSKVLGEEYDEFVFIVVEEEPPHLVAVYQLDRDDIEMGKFEAENLVRLYAKCTQEDYWPGYGDEIQMISMPRGAKPREVAIYD